MASNRRRFPRVRARGVAAHLRTEHGRAACQVENVSLGGLFVRTD
ncbi:MAG: PilZ domain-containing protein, partial [Myxococcales bacterium]